MDKQLAKALRVLLLNQSLLLDVVHAKSDTDRGVFFLPEEQRQALLSGSVRARRMMDTLSTPSPQAASGNEARYRPGDSPIVPVKIATFMDKVATMLAAPKPAVEAEPTYWAVWSVTGMHIGCWDDRATAERVFADDYPDGRIEALYTSPPSATETRNAALREAAKEARDKLAADYGPADGSTRRESYWSDHEALELCRQIDRALIDNTEGSEGANG